MSAAKEKDDHERRSAALAKDILLKYDISSEVIANVENCIMNHRVSKKTKTDDVLVQILRDADKLDAFGAIAIARTFHMILQDQFICQRIHQRKYMMEFQIQV